MSDTQNKEAQFESKNVPRNEQIPVDQYTTWFSLEALDIDVPENLLFFAILKDDGNLVSSALRGGASPNHVFHPKHKSGDGLPVYDGVFADQESIRRIEYLGLSAVALALASNSTSALTMLLDNGALIEDWYVFPAHMDRKNNLFCAAYFPGEAIEVLNTKKRGWIAINKGYCAQLCQKGIYPPDATDIPRTKPASPGCLSVIVVALGSTTAFALIHLLA